MLVLVVLALSLIVQGTFAAWLTCPASFNPLPGRSIEYNGPCEASLLTTAFTKTLVYAGDVLKVGWVSNNQGGGYVRLALVPLNERLDAAAFDRNVVKVTCFGHDTRPGMFYDGYCNHPCNARGGCDYQKQQNDTERYDTTIGIPTNLNDGYYILQWKAVSANNPQPAYSCTLLQIVGGDSKQECLATSPSTPNCTVTKDGGNFSNFISGSQMGSFCYSDDGSTDSDVNMGKKRPRNYGCDPRKSCELALIKEACKNELTEPTDTENLIITCPKDHTIQDDKEEEEMEIKKEMLQIQDDKTAQVAEHGHAIVVTTSLPPPIYPSWYSSASSTITISSSLLTRSSLAVSSKTTLASSKTPLASSKTALVSSKTTLVPSKTTLASSKTTLASSKTTLASSKTPLASSKTTLTSSKTTLASSKTALASSKTALVPSKSPLAPSSKTTTTILATIYSSDPSSTFTVDMSIVYESDEATTIIDRSSSSSSSTTMTSPVSRTTIIPGGSCHSDPTKNYCYGTSQFGQCVYGTWWIQSCPSDLICINGQCDWPNSQKEIGGKISNNKSPKRVLISRREQILGRAKLHAQKGRQRKGRGGEGILQRRG